MARVVPIAVATAVVLVVSGCSGPQVDASCDVEGVTHDVEHMVEEAGLTSDSVDALQCSGDWAVAEVTVSGPTTEPSAEVFVFQRSEFGWILKAPELVCGADPGLESVPDDLRDSACPEA